MRDEVMAVAAERPDWPQFRIGINTGPAVVGNVGAAGMHSFTAIGDTTNLSARLQAQARPGRIVISRATREAIGAAAEVEQLGPLELKGKQAPVEAFVLVSVAG
jgi:adenylate cyclase